MRYKGLYELRLMVQGRVAVEIRPMEVTRQTETRGLVTRAMVRMRKIKGDIMKIPSVWVGTMCIHFTHPREKRS